MNNKPTDDLLSALNCAGNFHKFMEENVDSFVSKNLPAYLDSLLLQKGLVKADVIKRSEINEIYAYQIFSGIKNPSRDKLISLSFGMELNLEETQQLLKAARCSALYARDKRDCIIIYSLQRHESVIQLNNRLYEQHEKTLG